MNNLRLALRDMLRRPMFAATIVLTLTIAIATTIAAFAFIDAVFLTRLPVRDQDRLMTLEVENPGAPFVIQRWPILGTNAPPVGDREALAAIISVARSDSSLGVRAEAMASMMGLFDESARAALIEFSHDTNAGIRASAARMLFGPFPDGLARLRELADTDPDQNVRSTAAEMLSMMRVQEPQQRMADSVMHSPTASDAERASAAAQLTNSFLPGAWDAGKQLLTAASSSRAVRQAVMRQMAIGVRYQFRPEAKAEELVALLLPYLTSEDPSLRLAAAREFSSTDISAARSALEERKRVEVDARVLRTIDESLGEMAKERLRPPGAPPK